MNWWTMRTATRALSSAPRALLLSNVINILAVPEPRSAYFLLLVQEKVRKEKDTRVAAPLERHERCPALLANTAREPNSPAGEEHTRSGSNTVSRNPAVLAAVLGLLYGD